PALPLRIVYSFNKKGYEADYWHREIAAASDERCAFLPFNHDRYLDANLYVRAQLLDHLYFARHPGLMRMYDDLRTALRDHRADALIVDNCFPYHPDFLRTVPVYKVLRTTDGPLTAYDRDFAYLHAYDHVLYHSPAYSSDMGMAEKLRYCGAKRADFVPLGLFDAAFDAAKTEETILAGDRDVEIVFIGALYPGKMPLMAKVKKAFGRHCRIHGMANAKKNLYFNFKYGFPGWVAPLPFRDVVPLYQRSRIGFNAHNRGDYTVGSYRLFDLPGNGVMQISDGGKHLREFFEVGEEIVGYESADDLVDKLRYYLAHDEERKRIALNGYRRVTREYRFKAILRRAGELILAGMQRGESASGWK
ncbi:MAG: glycosyltransferase family 1 protein, partial [Deltaproteobacteria bacterium]|nr:glycosyltransferase family 1 protein [Deltaproteobacteria bacterium]